MMRLLVSRCGIEMKNKEEIPMLVTVGDMMDDNVLGAMEAITNYHGSNYFRNKAYKVTDILKEYLARYHRSYATTLLESLELKSFREVNELREDQPSVSWLLCKTVARRCCGSPQKRMPSDLQNACYVNGNASYSRRNSDGSIEVKVDKISNNNNHFAMKIIDNKVDAASQLT